MKLFCRDLLNHLNKKMQNLNNFKYLHNRSKILDDTLLCLFRTPYHYILT